MKKSKNFIIFVSILICFLIVIPLISANELKSVQMAIEEKDVKWVAGETSVSSLSISEREKLILSIEESDIEELHSTLSTKYNINMESIPSSLASIPKSFDWRDEEGKNWITAIKNQRSCGSCWAFATISAVESKFGINRNNPNLNVDLSEQDLVSCGTGSCNGVSLLFYPSVLNRLIYDGTVDESCFPYTASDASCENKCSNWEDNAHKIIDWKWSWNSNMDKIKKLLKENGELITFITVYEDFDWYKSGIYDHAYGESRGIHLITIIGYNDEEEYWIIKNSWGTGWGEEGFAKISYDFKSGGLFFMIDETDWDIDGVPDKPETKQCEYDLDCKLFYNTCTCDYECIPKDTKYFVACPRYCEEKPTLIPKCGCINNRCETVYEIIVNITECRGGEIEYYNCGEGFKYGLWIKRKCKDGKWNYDYTHPDLCNCEINSFNFPVCEEGYSCNKKTQKCGKVYFVNATATITSKAIIKMNPIQKNCEGCLLDNKCVPLGYRTSDKYCDADKSLKNQKQEEENCNNNFECQSNICVDGKCISGGLIQKILNFFKKFFGL